MDKKIKLFFKFFVTCFIFYFIFTKIDFNDIVLQFKHINISYFFIALLCFNLSKIISSFRLNYYFQALSIQINQKTNLILYYIGMFYNLFLPGGIGGDGYKIYLLKKHFKTSAKSLIQATLLDRISGFVPLIILGSLFFLFSFFNSLSFYLNFLAVLCILLGMPLFFFTSKKFFDKFHGVFFQTLLWGFLVQIMQLLAFYFILQSLGVQDYILSYLFIFLLSSMAAILPITIGGAGTRELVFLYMLSILGVDVQIGISCALLFFLITVISSFIGFFLKNPLKGEI